MTLKRVPLHSRHEALGGRMVPFAGWEMPVQYSSIIEEHKAVRERAGLFDVSHMGEIIVSGDSAANLLEKLTCNNVADMKHGQVRYNAILNENGGLVDDVTIYRVNEKEFFVVSNASNYEKVVAHFKAFAEGDVAIDDQSSDWHLLALQGPLAENILSEYLNRSLSDIPYYRFADVEANGTALRVSRTGYTGEDGFEIYSGVAGGVRLWDELLEKGAGAGLLPAGLGARDILRLEAFYPLYGHELNEEWTPAESGIGFIVKEKENPYLGYEKILDHKKNGAGQRIRGLRLLEKGIPRDGYAIFDSSGENRIGTVLSGGYSPSLEVGIGSFMAPDEFAPAGTEILVEIRSRKFRAQVHAGAFYKGGAGQKKVV